MVLSFKGFLDYCQTCFYLLQGLLDYGQTWFHIFPGLLDYGQIWSYHLPGSLDMVKHGLFFTGLIRFWSYIVLCFTG